MSRSEEWRWYPAEPEVGTRSTMTVLVPDPTKTLVPFGFARALPQHDRKDGWDEHAALLAGSGSAAGGS